MTVRYLRSFPVLFSVVIGLVAAGCGSDGPAGPTPVPCTYSLSSQSQNLGSDGGTGAVTVTTQDGCQWTAVSGVAWVSVVAGASGTGSGSVSFAVAANQAEASRSATIAIAGQTFTVNETGRAPCTFDVGPQQQAFSANGGAGSVAVAAPAGCAWTATSTAAWLTIVSGSTGEGNGTVTFSVAANSATSTRNGGLTVADLQVTIDQAAAEPQPPPPPPPAECQYNVAAVDIRMHWHHTGGEVALTTASGCTWSVASDTEWLGLVSASQGSGSETIRFSMSPYTEENSRAAALKVRWPTPTAGQNVWITQEGCRYAVSITEQNFTADSGSSAVYVYGTPISTTCMIGCPWTATSQASWIHILTPMPNAGDDRFTYQVDANPGSQERVGQILVERRIVTIRQAGR